MSTYRVFKYTNRWSTSDLTGKVEDLLPQMEKEGWTIVSVSFGVDLWWCPTAFVTVKK